MRTVFNPKVYRTKLTRSYAIAIIISILAMPIGVFTSKTYADLAFSTHTSVSYKITSDSSFSIACTSNITVFIFSNVHIYDARIIRSEFAISTNSSPCTVFSFNVTATDFDSRCYCTDCFVSTFIFISNNINHAIDDDFRFNARCTVHCFDYCTISGIACTCTSNDRTTITIVNINFTATISEDGSSLSTASCSSGNITGVIDFNNTFINCRNTGTMGICRCIHYKLITVQINFSLITRAGCRYCSTDVREPQATCNQIVINSNCCLFFSKFIYAIFQDFVFNICGIFCFNTKDRRSEGIFSLAIRFEIQSTLTSFSTEFNITLGYCFSNRRSSKSFCNLYKTCKIIFTINISSIIQLFS